MQRRSFLTALGTAPLMAAVQRPSPSSRPPRKVIAGTVMQSYWEPHPGLEKRLARLTANVDSMQTESQRAYGRGLDLAILPARNVPAMLDQYLAAAGPAPLPVHPSFAAQVSSAAPFKAEVPLPPGQYFLVIDHSTAFGTSAPVGTSAAKVDYLVQLGDTP